MMLLNKSQNRERKVLIIGSAGMAGHMITNYLKENSNFEITSWSRKELEIDEIESWKSKLIEYFETNKPDFLINCIGILKVANLNPILGLRINSLFPHQLAEICSKFNVKIIHLSSDCYGDLDIYGRSKRAGEINYPDHLTIRTSIIGPELKEDGSGLFHWFMIQKETAFGFVNHVWDGVTTLQLAKFIKFMITTLPDTRGIIDYRTREKINKYNLLGHIKNIFKKEIEIQKKETLVVDKTNQFPDQICELSFEEQLTELQNWMFDNQPLYSQYFLPLKKTTKRKF